MTTGDATRGRAEPPSALGARVKTWTQICGSSKTIPDLLTLRRASYSLSRPDIRNHLIEGVMFCRRPNSGSLHQGDLFRAGFDQLSLTAQDLGICGEGDQVYEYGEMRCQSLSLTLSPFITSTFATVFSISSLTRDRSGCNKCCSVIDAILG